MNAKDVYPRSRARCLHTADSYPPCEDCLAGAAREYHESQLRLGLGEPPVSEERVEEIRSHWDESRVAMPPSVTDLLALVDHYRLLVAALARDNPDAAEAYRAGYRAGIVEGKHRCVEAVGEER